MTWPENAVTPRRRTVIAIPASLVSDVPHLRERTLKVGLVGRAAAIFRVDEVTIYYDMGARDQIEDANFIRLILEYMETPQYLRKGLFRLLPGLRYAGILPPLRTPHHPTSCRLNDLHVGEFREGRVLRLTRRGALVDVGVEKPILVGNLRRRGRVTVKLMELGEKPTGIVVDRDLIPTYWGYRIEVSDLSLGSLMAERMKESIVIATSRYGRLITDVETRIKEALRRYTSATIIFGSPKEGLSEILRREGLRAKDVSHFVVNAIPFQGTKTVRTEEAIYACLSIFNALYARTNTLGPSIQEP
ncbi:MAG: putative RNA uridine N3 methyltransferase [Candidatus Bathyarchaeia archaeon]